MKNLTLLIIILCPLFSIAQTLIEIDGISQTNINLTNSTVVGQIAINPSQSGKVVVRFDGSCISSVGDRIVLAASNTTNWTPNDGNVSVEAVDNDVNRNSFSHSRVYSISPGLQTFYAVAHNVVETDGTGIASIYGSLTVEFFPDNSNNTNPISPQVLVETNDGDIYVDNYQRGIILKSQDGNCWRMTMNSNGIAQYSQVSCS